MSAVNRLLLALPETDRRTILRVAQRLAEDVGDDCFGTEAKPSCLPLRMDEWCVSVMVVLLAFSPYDVDRVEGLTRACRVLDSVSAPTQCTVDADHQSDVE